MTLADTVAPVRVQSSEGDAAQPLELEFAWARMYFDTLKWGQRTPILATCHGDLYEGYTLVRFYLKSTHGFEPALQFPAHWGYLKEPQLFTVEQDHFVHLRHNSGGSSASWNYDIVWLGESDVRRIPIQQPVEALAHLLHEGQHSAPYRTFIQWEEGQLRFSFSIWNADEHNNFPTGGRVDGTMTLERDDEGRPRRFGLHEWAFHPPDRESSDITD